MIMITLVTREY